MFYYIIEVKWKKGLYSPNFASNKRQYSFIHYRPGDHDDSTMLQEQISYFL